MATRVDEISESFDANGMDGLNHDDVEHLLNEVSELQSIYEGVTLWVENTYSYFKVDTEIVSPESDVIALLEGIAGLFKKAIGEK
jgi:hypothetical protein